MFHVAWCNGARMVDTFAPRAWRTLGRKRGSLLRRVFLRMHFLLSFAFAAVVGGGEITGQCRALASSLPGASCGESVAVTSPTDLPRM